MSQQKAVLCHRPNEDKFSFSFHLECEEPKISRQFNMNRPTSELLETFLIRIKENIGKRLESKTKKKKKAKKTPTDDCGSSTETVRACRVFNSKVDYFNHMLQSFF